MEPVVGIFSTRAEAENSIRQLQYAGIANNRINLLTPKSSEADIASVPTTDAEQPGMGEAIGGVVGGAVGAAGGLSLGTAAASLSHQNRVPSTTDWTATNRWSGTPFSAATGAAF